MSGIFEVLSVAQHVLNSLFNVITVTSDSFVWHGTFIELLNREILVVIKLCGNYIFVILVSYCEC